MESEAGTGIGPGRSDDETSPAANHQRDAQSARSDRGVLPPFLLEEPPAYRASKPRGSRAEEHLASDVAEGGVDTRQADVRVDVYARIARLTRDSVQLDAALSPVLEITCEAAGFQAAHVRCLEPDGRPGKDWWPAGEAERLEALHRSTVELDAVADLSKRAAAADEIQVVGTDGDVVAGGGGRLTAKRAAAARTAGFRWIVSFSIRAASRPAALVEVFSVSDTPPEASALEMLDYARALLESLASRERARAAVRRAAAHVRGRERREEPVATRLRALEERHALLLRGSGEGLWEWDIRTDRIVLSPSAWAMLGCAPEDSDFAAARWLERVHPDDRARLDIELFEHLDGQSSRLETEHRLRHEDGGWRWVRVRGIAQRNGQGRAVRVAGSMSDITAERTAEERDFRDLFYHPLTKLPTRALLVDRLTQALGRRTRGPDHCFAVLDVGIQGMRDASNRLVPGAADELLATVAGRLGCILRAGDTVAHLADEEFAVLLEGIDSPEDALQIGRRMQEAVREPISLGDGEIVLETDVGAVIARSRYDRPEDLLRDASVAMRRGRRAGGQIRLFEEGGGARQSAKADLGEQFGEALAKNLLRLEYQPIVALDDGRIKGLEALLRWDHPVHGRIPPYEFLPLAEERGLMEAVTFWVLHRACRQVVRWDARLALTFPPTIAVNIHERQLHVDGFVERALDIVDASGLEAARVRLDISEGALTRDVRTAARALEALKERGVLAAIDDFGTGHVSLGYLHRFPVGVIKIDRSLVSGAAARANHWYLARTIVELARVLELEVIAEGIETREQFQRLRALGCRQGQGFFFSGPVPPPAAESLLRDGYPLDPRAPTR